MTINDRIINIIEDHESIVQVLDQIYTALKGGKPMPNYIPLLNDAIVTDQLSVICEELNKKRS